MNKEEIELYKKLRYCLNNKIWFLVYDKSIINNYTNFAFENGFKLKEIQQIEFFTYRDLFNYKFVFGRHRFKFIIDCKFDYKERLDSFFKEYYKDKKDLERQFLNLPHELAFKIKSSSEFLKIACLNEKDYQKILEETTKSLKLKYQEKEFNLKTQIDNINQKNNALNYFLANANQVEYKK
jgi:hypothetical protein